MYNNSTAEAKGIKGKLVRGRGISDTHGNTKSTDSLVLSGVTNVTVFTIYFYNFLL